MKTKDFSFSNWLAGRQAVSFTLAVGVFFLISNYQGIIYRANPDNVQAFSYPFIFQVIASHLDSFFFGLATAIIIFQAQKEWQKITYCCFEGLMIFLNLNRNFINGLGLDSQALLATYVAVFSAFTLYFLGILAKNHREITQKTFESVDLPELTPEENKEEEKAIEELLKDTNVLINKEKTSVVCPICSTEHEPLFGKKLYCSEKCKNKAKNSQRKKVVISN